MSCEVSQLLFEESFSEGQVGVRPCLNFCWRVNMFNNYITGSDPNQEWVATSLLLGDPIFKGSQGDGWYSKKDPMATRGRENDVGRGAGGEGLRRPW